MKFINACKNMKLNWKLTFVTLLTVMITLAVLSGILFYEQEQNVVEENKNYMAHKLESGEATIENCITSINMSTQFFLADETMLYILNTAKEGGTLETSEIVEYQSKDIKNLERLVSNNPVLYAVRYYSTVDNVQELMPILYKASRMEKLSWAESDTLEGWHFGYLDTAFSSLITGQKTELACLITVVSDYRNGDIGVIEASIPMEEIFPSLYEDQDKEFAFFVTDGGEAFYGSSKKEDTEELVEALSEAGALETSESVTYVTIDGRKLLLSKLYSKKLSGTLVEVLDITEEIHGVWTTRDIFIAVMILVLIALALTVNIIVKRMLRQFYMILEAMSEVREGNLDVRIEKLNNDEMGTLGTSLNRMLDRIQKLMEENINREVLVKNSEIRALQNQINAHFIYNVLESIKMMAEIDEKYEISDAITSLGKLLRYSMRWVSGNVKVREELEYIKNYMALINLRYDYPIHLAINVEPDIMELEIPKMSLQPVVENAILHGIEPLGEESTIYIKGWLEDGDCIIEVSDTGKGMTDEELSALLKKIAGEIEVSGGKGNGIGLKNVHDRVTMAFGQGYGLSIYTKLDCYTKVAIKIPAKVRKNENSINS